MKELGYISAEDYLEFDDAMENRYEYMDGVVIEWNGDPIEPQYIYDELARIRAERDRPKNGNRPLLSTAILCALMAQLKDRTYNCLHKAPVETGNHRFEPSVTVGTEPEYKGEGFAFDATNTRVVIEVLSETITNAAFTERLNSFLGMASLKAYLLVSQREPLVQVYARMGDGRALYLVYRGLDAVVPLECIGCKLKLSEVYRRTKFEEAD
jgi:hypothetical protein